MEVGLSAANDSEEARDNMMRILRQAELAGLHGKLTLEVDLKHGKPVQFTTTLSAKGVPRDPTPAAKGKS